MSRVDLNIETGSVNQEQTGIKPIDVASQHVTLSIDWLLEKLQEGDELSPEMRKELKEKAGVLFLILMNNLGN